MQASVEPGRAAPLGGALPIISGPARAPGPVPEVFAAPEPVPARVERPVPAPGAAPETETTFIAGADDGKTRIAVLLPLTGPNAPVGRALLNAAQIALFDFAGDRFVMLTHDTRGTPEGAADAARLAIGDGAKLIAGPLLASSVEAVKPIAAQADVPVIAFSSDRTVASPGVYTLGFLPGDQIRRVVRFARSRGIERFAALAPQNAYGAAVMAAYRDAVAESGGQLVTSRFYSPAAEGHDEIVKDLANYDQRRADLLAQRRELEGGTDEVSQRALKRLDRLQTIGDLPYEALLVADGGARLQAIAALLPFYDIDPAKIRMLGTGQWDVPGIGSEPALAGAWFAAPEPQAREDFEDQYEAVYGAKPPRLATLAYDAVALASVLGANGETDSLTPGALTDPAGFAGRDGIFRLRPGGETERGLAVLQVGPRGNRVVDPAPRTFEALTN